MNGPSPRRRTVFREIVINLAFAGVRGVLLMLLVRYAGLFMASAALGYFLLSRRTGATLSNFLQFGMTQTVLRSVSMNLDKGDVLRAYLIWVMAVTIGMTAISLPFTWIYRDWLGLALFGTREGTGMLAFWTVMMTIVTATSMLPITFMLAQRHIVSSNILRSFNVGGAALVALFFWGANSTPEVVTRDTALLLGGLATVYMAYQFFELKGWYWTTRPLLGAAGRDFITYGMPRAFSTSLETLGAFIAPWLLRHEPAEAGYFLISLTLLSMVRLVLTPLTQIVAMSGARSLGTDGDDTVSRSTAILIGLSIIVGGLTTAVLVPWEHQLLHLWLGRASLAEGASYYVDSLMWATTPIILFYMLRNIIEVRWHYPYNLITQAIAIALQLGLYSAAIAMGWAVRDAAMISMAAFLWVQGGFTLYWCIRDFPRASFWGLWQFVLSVGTVAAINIWASGAPSALRIAIAAVVSLAALYLAFVQYRPEMISEIMQMRKRVA